MCMRSGESKRRVSDIPATTSLHAGAIYARRRIASLESLRWSLWCNDPHLKNGRLPDAGLFVSDHCKLLRLSI